MPHAPPTDSFSYAAIFNIKNFFLVKILECSYNNIMELVKINPETMDVANTYLECFSIDETAKRLEVSPATVTDIIETSEVKRYIDSVFLDSGYRNKHRMAQLLDKIVDSKLEEAIETEIYTGKDLLDVLKFIHEISKESDKPTKQTNVQINNYGKLMEKLTK